MQTINTHTHTLRHVHTSTNRNKTQKTRIDLITEFGEGIPFVLAETCTSDVSVSMWIIQMISYSGVFVCVIQKPLHSSLSYLSFKHTACKEFCYWDFYSLSLLQTLRMKYEQFNCALKFTQFTLENRWGIAGTRAGKNPVGYSFKNVLWESNSCIGIVEFM